MRMHSVDFLCLRGGMRRERNLQHYSLSLFKNTAVIEILSMINAAV